MRLRVGLAVCVCVWKWSPVSTSRAHFQFVTDPLPVFTRTASIDTIRRDGHSTLPPCARSALILECTVHACWRTRPSWCSDSQRCLLARGAHTRTHVLTHSQRPSASGHPCALSDSLPCVPCRPCPQPCAHCRPSLYLGQVGAGTSRIWMCLCRTSRRGRVVR